MPHCPESTLDRNKLDHRITSTGSHANIAGELVCKERPGRSPRWERVTQVPFWNSTHAPPTPASMAPHAARKDPLLNAAVNHSGCPLLPPWNGWTEPRAYGEWTCGVRAC